ncbi:hypothetical protein HDU97_005765 [Phlyctochytrium planicorne]|nr:hypothetical protein HDU97_005765 [Phlyctochytrium planicorne]
MSSEECSILSNSFPTLPNRIPSVKCCQFYPGITCNGDSITEIRIQGLGLKQELPAGLGDLPNLAIIQLDNNKFTGEIPESYKKLKKLQSINLYGSQITGQIPSWVDSWPDLKWFDVEYNQMTGPLPATLGNLKNLQMLWLQGNKFTGSLPSNLFDLPALNGILASDNLLSGKVPSIPPQMKTILLGNNCFDQSDFPEGLAERALSAPNDFILAAIIESNLNHTRGHSFNVHPKWNCHGDY